MTPSRPLTLSILPLLWALLFATQASGDLPGPGLVVHEQPRPTPDRSFLRGDGEKVDLESFSGKVVLVHLWAPWCEPCRAEMPVLDRLQAEMGGDGFEVVAVSLDRGPASRSREYLESLGVENLALYVDRSTRLRGDFGVPGIPASILISRGGEEVARLHGSGDWDGEGIRGVLRGFLDR